LSPIILPQRYASRGLLGQGGIARIIRVFDTVLERELALKVVGEPETAWLKREFNLLRQIRHENLVRVFDWGTLPDGNPYYTMEVVDGQDLGTIITSPISMDRLLAILTGILRGIGHLHCHGEVHGDLKPSNVLLGLGGAVKVGDVGMGNSGECSTAGSGTPGYTAPEVWAGEPVSVRSDIYSVGVLAYEAITGVHPFARRTVREVITSQVEGWVPSPGAHGVVLPADIERSLMRSLERDPRLRQASADELIEGMGLGEGLGEILGGRFVDRVEELDRFRKIAHGEDSRRPTLLYLVGPSGIGKSALLDEVVFVNGFECRSADCELKVQNTEQDSTEGSKKSVSIGELGHSERVSSLSAALLRRHSTAYTLLVEDNPLSGDDIRSIARYVWAEAIERGQARQYALRQECHQWPGSVRAV
jgi:serine/threonine protein kinase